MATKIAIINSLDHFELMTFDNSLSDSKRLEITELENDNELTIALYEKDKMNEQVSDLLNKLQKIAPVRCLEDFSISKEELQNIDSDSLNSIVKKSYEQWTLSNNVSLINEIFQIRNHLLPLWKNDRHIFFEELWYLAKRNLGAQSLTIFYNSLKEVNGKKTLIHCVVEGQNSPTLRDAKDFEGKLIKELNLKADECFEILEYSEEKNELTASASIDQGPILFMCKLNTINALQTSIINALFKGLNE